MLLAVSGKREGGTSTMKSFLTWCDAVFFFVRKPDRCKTGKATLRFFVVFGCVFCLKTISQTQKKHK